MPSNHSSQSLFTRRIAVPQPSEVWPEGCAVDVVPEDSEPDSPPGHQLQDLLPRVGQSFLHFRIVDVLGEGAVGKVYLAEQPELAGRYVALKLSTDLLGEPAKLARLQHPAIMPVYSVHECGGVQAVCMPYYGRTTLADWCQSLGMMATMPSSGQQLVSTLMSKRRSLATIDQVPSLGEAVQVATEGTSTPLDVLATLKYSDAILLTIARIAEGLQHAHERGLVHQDLKPANILITDEGLPLILDFNLARDTRQENPILRAQVGGTLPYMSPEQLLGFSDKSATVAIDGRSDIYSLGLILFQLLAGRRPFLTPCGSIHDIVTHMLKERQKLPPDVRQFNPEVDAGTAAIVAKCLHPQPARRYQSAAELVEDIRRHRADLPLRYAANTSLSERLAKWMRRHPRLASPATVLAAASLLTLGVVAWGTQATIAQSQAEYRQLHTKAHQLFVEFHERCSVAEHYLSAHVDRSPWRERGQQEAQEALKQLGVWDCEAWTQQPTVAALSPEQQRQLEQRVGELAHFLILADTPSHPKAESASSSDAVSRLPTEAQLRRQRLRQLQEQWSEKRLSSGRLAYYQAYEWKKQGKHGQVLDVLQKYLQAYPSDVNAWFTLARSAYLLGRLSEAYHAYSTCVALRPQFAPGYYNRALVAFYFNIDPLSDLQTVLKLEPESLEARFLLALVLQRQKKYPHALRELQILLDREPSSPRFLHLRAQLYEAMGNPRQARADRQAALLCRCSNWQEGLAQADLLIDRDPKAALARYRALERDDPSQVEPLLGQVYIYGEQLQQPAQALECLERLHRHHPEHIDTVCGRAVYLARLRRDAEALSEARRALRLSNHSFTHYRVGCVYALLSQRDPRHKEAALHHLMLALDDFQGVDVFLEDPDLQHVRKLTEFRTLVDFVRLSRHHLRRGDRF